MRVACRVGLVDTTLLAVGRVLVDVEFSAKASTLASANSDARVACEFEEKRGTRAVTGLKHRKGGVRKGAGPPVLGIEG